MVRVPGRGVGRSTAQQGSAALGKGAAGRSRAQRRPRDPAVSCIVCLYHISLFSLSHLSQLLPTFIPSRSQSEQCAARLSPAAGQQDPIAALLLGLLLQ